MNLRWYIGSKFNSALNNLLSNQAFPLTRYFPRGQSVFYDIQRFSKKKKLNTLFDIGANVGQTANGLVRYFPKSQIYCFEPVSTTFNILSQKFSSYSNVTCVQKGIGSVSGSANIILHENSELNTIIINGPRENTKIGEETIVIETLDNFAETQNISHIDFLKMDVQGWEMEVLLGAKRLLQNKCIRFVYTEVGFRRSDRDMQHFSEINDYLENQGFWLCGFYDPFRWGEKKEYLGFANALYIQPDFKGH
jgi:FkbM family methyltransferase